MTQVYIIILIGVLCFCAGVIVGRSSTPQAGGQTAQSHIPIGTPATTYGRYGNVAPSTFAGISTKEPTVIDLNAKK